MNPWMNAMSPTFKALALVSLGAAIVTGAFLAGKARAAGIPDANVLTYTGYLEDGDGQPLTGNYSIAVRFWESEEASRALCTGELASAEVRSGRFQVPLPAECVDAVKANPNLFVDVTVEGASLGRTKLGAVPYAIEAGHAMTADEASGALAARLDGFDDQLADVEARVPKITAWKLEESGTSTRWSDGTAAPVTDRTYVWRRVGDSVEVRVRATFSSALSSIIFMPPPLLAFDSAKGAVGSVGGGRVWIHSTSSLEMLDCFPASLGGVSCIGRGVSPPYLGSGWPSGSYAVDITYTLPIQGWTTTTP